MGQTGRPWSFLPIAFRAAATHPEDAPLRILIAVNLGRLGLRTVALEHLAATPGDDPQVAALAGAIARLPNDRIGAETLRATCTTNLTTLRDRATDPGFNAEAGFPAWSASLDRAEWFRAADGNIVRRRRAGPGSTPEWERFADERGQARAITFEADSAGPGEGPGHPVTIDGFDPPWLLQHALAPRHSAPSPPALDPPGEDGHRASVSVVEPDPSSLLNGLASVDLQRELADPRVRVFAGPDAASGFAAWLGKRATFQITGRTAWNGHGAPVGAERLAAAVTAQQEELARLRARVGALYGARTRAWWAQRYREAAEGGAPLRILLPTSRYTTFLRHSAGDLAAAFRAAGCEAQVLIEPDDSCRLTALAYLSRVAEFTPDLVVLINYTRSHLADALPAELPCVCWVQDAMAHLFDARAGSAQTGLDFIAGHTHADLVERFGYPANRRLPLAVVASAAKFHPGPLAPGLAQAHACEIAYVSHHGETPEGLHARLCRAEAAAPAIVEVFERLFTEVRAIAGAVGEGPAQPALREVALRAARDRLGVEPDARTEALLLNQYAFPLADRFIRHETVGWAASIAERRSWRLRLHGRGWPSHPRFAPFAAGPLEHGESLRASYGTAAAHLHASVHWNHHQRVMECALSGGLPLCRRKADDLALLTAQTMAMVAERGEPCLSHVERRQTCYTAADRPESLAYLALLQRLGSPWGSCPSLWFGEGTLGRCRVAAASLPLTMDSAWLLGDWAQTTFATEAELERALERAVERPGWRASCSRGIARRTRTHFTYDAAASAMLGIVSASLRE